MIRLFLALFLVVSLVSANPTRTMEDLEGNHIKTILQQKHNSLLTGQFNFAVSAAEMIANGKKITKLVQYSVCEKDNLSSYYTQKEDHAIYMFCSTKQEGENISVWTACHIIEGRNVTGQIDIIVSFSKEEGISLKTRQNIVSKETTMLEMCAKDYEEKILSSFQGIRVSKDTLKIANYILTRVYGKIGTCQFEELDNEAIHKEVGADPSARYSTRCLGRHSSYGLICIIGSFSGITDCAKRAGECGCYEAIWYYTTVYMCGTICK